MDHRRRLEAHDVLHVRLQAADTIMVDFSLLRCAWRAMRRSRERADVWRCSTGSSHEQLTRRMGWQGWGYTPAPDPNR